MTSSSLELELNHSYMKPHITCLANKQKIKNQSIIGLEKCMARTRVGVATDHKVNVEMDEHGIQEKRQFTL